MLRSHPMSFSRLTLLPLVLILACGDTPATPPASTCTPNQQLACPCPGSNTTGVQVCDSAGQSFSACTGCGLASGGQGGASAGQGGTAQAGAGQAGGLAGGAGGVSSGGSGQGGSAPAGQGGAPGEAGQGGAGCSGYAVELMRRPAQVLLVVDRSGSMADNGKWPAVNSGLNQTLAQTSDELDVGMVRFPEGSTSSCSPLDIYCAVNFECSDIKDVPNVPVAPLQKTREPIQNLLATTSPDGNTPTRWALRKAWAAQKASPVVGDKYVVLLTDGEPTYAMNAMGSSEPVAQDCGSQQDLLQETSASFQQSPPVRTLVLGIPGSEKAQSTLSAIAQNGGGCRPGGSPQDGSCHYQFSQSALDSSLAQVGAEVLSSLRCRFQLAAPFSAGGLSVTLRVLVDGIPIQVPEGGPNGWSFTSESPQIVQLSGDACEQVNAAKSVSAQLEANCL